ncbi:developmental pluripotency-associated protein 3 [Camelus ferus]|uniref:Developmental pluripotency-associated protein 3 n=1 Tax=Camelus ferus TaxID=419612 RepID=A0A8B8SGI3_CAMFR|nr:developmental pluripotency-associated protein 3 [Camelus ferus]
MDSSEPDPTWTLESAQMSMDENSQEVPAASQSISEVLVKNLSNLTLNPSTILPSHLPDQPRQESGRTLGKGILYRRRGARTLLTARQERMERMIQFIKNRYSGPFPMSRSQREPRSRDVETQSRVEIFRCTCNYCLYHRDLSQDTYEN